MLRQNRYMYTGLKVIIAAILPSGNFSVEIVKSNVFAVLYVQCTCIFYTMNFNCDTNVELAEYCLEIH
jgi:hypothetical protein